MDCRKEAVVRIVKGRKGFAFSKAWISDLPHSIFVSDSIECRLVRDGIHQQRPKFLKPKNLKIKGLSGEQLQEGDKVVLDYVDDKTFYQQLLNHGQLDDSVVVWIDPMQLKELDALESSRTILGD